ncbi:MAG: hypothetical protein ACFFD2_19550 [Promethearchaeota archaeon]
MQIGIDFYLWIVAIIILFVAMVFFLRKRMETDVTSQRNLFLGIALFFGLYGVALILFKIEDYGLPPPDDSFMHDLFWRLAATSSLIGFIFFIAVLELYALNKKTKFLATLAGIVTLVLSIIGGPEIGRQALIYGTPVMGLLVLFFYLYLSIVGRGNIRKKALQGFFGIFLLFLGIVMDNITV